MTDIVPPDVRSRMMSGIKCKNTIPEIVIRKQLHGLGFRYRLHDRRLPGKPDIIFPKHHAVIFVHGCFWHGHDCSLFKYPSSNSVFWRKKINSNRVRDFNNLQKLQADSWRVAIVWECVIKKSQDCNKELVQILANWLTSNSIYLEIQN